MAPELLFEIITLAIEELPAVAGLVRKVKDEGRTQPTPAEIDSIKESAPKTHAALTRSVQDVVAGTP